MFFVFLNLKRSDDSLSDSSLFLPLEPVFKGIALLFFPVC